MLKRKKSKKVEGKTNSLIGPGTEFKGTLKDREGVRIDGKFEGEIETGGSLIIGEDAIVNANIKAATVIISGKVKGDIDCEGKVEIYPTSSLEGKVKASDLTIAEGAFFNGECRMSPSTHRVEIEEEIAKIDKETE